jgi:hypothetical protein
MSPTPRRCADRRATRTSLAGVAPGVLTSALSLVLWASVAAAQSAAPPPPPPTWQVAAVNVLRVESWRFFAPRPGGGDPDYASSAIVCASICAGAGGGPK